MWKERLTDGQYPQACCALYTSSREYRRMLAGKLVWLAPDVAEAFPTAEAVNASLAQAYELEILGSHGMQAHRYDALFAMIEARKLKPAELIGRTITLQQSIDALMNMDKFEGAGVTVVTEF